MTARERVRTWLREPLLHFLLIGFALFVLSQSVGGAGGGSGRIVVSKGRIDALAAAFARTRQRSPNAVELKGLVDDYVREELATREALAIGLDRDDTIIRRRLRQKLEFVVEDTADAEAPTDADLTAWLAAHPDSYREEPRAAFRNVYFSPERRPVSLTSDAAQLLTELALADGDADISGMGDATLLPREVQLLSQSAIAREFGDPFAEEIMDLEPGRWLGPVRSAYGLHLVFIVDRKEGFAPPLEEVRSAVERDVLADRRTRQIDTMYEQLLARYDVVVEWENDSAMAEASPR